MAGQPYCSPLRYGLGAYGIDTSSFRAAQLRQKLVQATAAVDRWTNRPLIPSRADLRGGTITGEQHTWNVPGDFAGTLGDRRVYLNVGPVLTIESFAVKFTNSYEITLPPDNLFINNQGGYIEIIASQPTIIGFPPLGWLFGLSQPVTTTTYTYGWRFPIVGDILEAESPTLYVASHGNWLAGGDVVVEVDGTPIDEDDYSVSEDDGSIAFDAAAQPDPGTVVTASYVMTLPEEISTACGLVATALMGQSRIAARGLLGLQSLRVAEVALTTMQGQPGMVSRNGTSIPAEAAQLLAPFALGSVG